MNRRMRKRLTDKEKKAIWILSHVSEMKKTEIAELFGVSRSRVSQICNDYYGDLGRLGLRLVEDEGE
jgi:DNA-directed RNA polymerase specialized sigma subunit